MSSAISKSMKAVNQMAAENPANIEFARLMGRLGVCSKPERLSFADQSTVETSVVIVPAHEWDEATRQARTLATVGVTQVVFTDHVLAQRWAQACGLDLS